MTGHSTVTSPITRREHMVRAGGANIRNVRRARAGSIPAARAALALLMVFASVVAITGHPASVTGAAVTRFETVTVAEGGNLWQIATAHPVQGLETAETVDLIRATNRLATSVVHVGQTLRVPAQGPAGASLASR